MTFKELAEAESSSLEKTTESIADIIARESNVIEVTATAFANLDTGKTKSFSPIPEIPSMERFREVNQVPEPVESSNDEFKRKMAEIAERKGVGSGY